MWYRNIILLVALFSVFHHAYAADSTLIPESALLELRSNHLAASDRAGSYVAQRRALKNVIRQGQAIVAEAPAAPNRFEVLAIIFKGQKRLLSLENTDKNREALFQTCEALIEAPDDYATARLQADLILSEKRLTASNATMVERAADLSRLIERYADTEAEAKSLMMAAMIAKKLGVSDLQVLIKHRMIAKFGDDHEMIAFRREQDVHRLDSTFAGDFERLDGTSMRFPVDIMGHMSFMVFWSNGDSTSEALLPRIKEYQDQYPGRLRVYSFNIDELPDGGQSVLRKQGLDWTVMKLPGGRKNSAYRAYARDDAVAIFVNAYGRVILKPEAHFDATGWRSEQTDVYSISGERISDERYIAQLQWLMAGEFLLGEAPLTEKRAPFVSPPFRYRLREEEALGCYRQSVEGDQESKIIGLMGMWKLECEPKHLVRAMKEAESALAGELPTEQAVVPRFCLARSSLREGAGVPDEIVTRFFEECGGSNNAPASAVAAASVLAIDARSRTLHDHYRDLFLRNHSEDPAFYSFTSFLREGLHRYRLLMPNHTKRERWGRGVVVGFYEEPKTNRLPRLELQQLNGQPLILPKENTDKMTILAFLEPPEEPETNFSPVIDAHGRTNKTAGVEGMMSYAQLFVDKHINGGIELVAVFLCDDAQRVDWLMKTNNWTCQAAMLSGGLKNPMVNRLGILSADKFPNVYLVRRDGAIAWSAPGLPYREYGSAWVHHLGMKVNIEQCDLEYGYSLLEKGEFKAAAKIFAGPFLPWRPDRYRWRPVRYHGRALALVSSKDWEPALTAIQKSIDAHKLRHFRGARSKSMEDWQKDGATVVMSRPCNVISELWSLKAIVLDELGRADEAKALRARYEDIEADVHEDVYQRFHEKLREFRLKNSGPK